jgi:signal transduction histidine kinase
MDRGLGLVGIRERIELLNGSFNLKTAPGAGTQLLVEIPLKKKER